MIFDTWGGTLAHDDYEPFSLAYSRRVLDAREARADGFSSPRAAIRGSAR